jgi:GNAT superfamily N-acetyltransferase
MGIEIRRVDPDDDRAVQDFYDIYVACGRDLGGFVAAPREELASAIRQPTENFACTAFLAYDGDEAVGEGWYRASLRANLDLALATPRVPPRYRRRGIGSVLLKHLEQHARASGRTTLATTVAWAMEYGPEGTGAPSVEFARQHGYPLMLAEAGRRLDLPVPAELLDELSARADPAYTIRAFTGPVPEELVQGWAELDASLPTEAPTGALRIDETPPSVEAVRQGERLLADTGQVRYATVAISPDGEVAGYSAIVVRSADAPAGQWGTLVRRRHRGHGLGYGVKSAVIRLLQQERPDITTAITSNALTNKAMTAVNHRLGYQLIEYLGDVQKRLS